MTRRLLLVDGTNLVMRAAFGGDIPPPRASQVATAMLARAIAHDRPTHLIVAYDHPTAPNWRRSLFVHYKGHRMTESSQHTIAFAHALELRGTFGVMAAGFEADDLIATLVERAHQHFRVAILSGDSDMHVLVRTPREGASCGVYVVRPESGGTFTTLATGDICAKYGLRLPSMLTDFKALVGETCDNVPGVPGIGPKRAVALLNRCTDLDGIIAHAAEPAPGTSDARAIHRDAQRVRQHAEAAQLARQLVSLRTDAPVPPIQPKRCALGEATQEVTTT